MTSEVKIIAPPAKEILDRIGDPQSPGLRRNELTPYAKRWQLWGKGVRGNEADRIIDQIYPPAGFEGGRQ